MDGWMDFMGRLNESMIRAKNTTQASKADKMGGIKPGLAYTLTRIQYSQFCSPMKWNGQFIYGPVRLFTQHHASNESLKWHKHSWHFPNRLRPALHA
eukprot:scaffold137394_cov49-Prasinocladus_malaysianus.AAC.1